MTSISRSWHLSCTAAGRPAASSVAMRPASCSAMATSGRLVAMRPASLCVAQARAGAAEAWNAVHQDHHREGDHQHDDAEHRDGAEVAALVEVEDEHGDHLGLRGE